MASRKSNVDRGDKDLVDQREGEEIIDPPVDPEPPMPNELNLKVATVAADQVAIEYGQAAGAWWSAGGAAAESEQAIADLAAYATANPGLDGEVYYRHAVALGVHEGENFAYFDLPVWSRLSYEIFAAVINALNKAQQKEAKRADEAAARARPPAGNPLQNVPIEDTILEQEDDPLATHKHMELSKPGAVDDHDQA